jgi:hypothetical protein
MNPSNHLGEVGGHGTGASRVVQDGSSTDLRVTRISDETETLGTETWDGTLSLQYLSSQVSKRSVWKM